MLSVSSAMQMFSNFRNMLRCRGTLLILGGLILLWVLFFDSHSILNRVRWHQEANQLREENQKMETVVERSKEELSRRGDEEEIERIARESYGMRRDGETVYKVEEGGD